MELKKLFILTIFIFFLSGESNGVEPDSTQSFNFSITLQSGKEVIYQKSLLWLKKLNQEKAVIISGEGHSDWLIKGRGQVFIKRFGSGNRIPAKFSFKIKCRHHNFSITYYNLRIYQHNMIASSFIKGFEQEALKPIFNSINNDLVEFIIQKEKEFLEWFNKWDRGYFDY